MTYDHLVDYFHRNGYKRNQLTLDEFNLAMVTTHHLRANSTGCVVDIPNPCNHKITIMGKRQVPKGFSTDTAHSLRLILGNNEKEIDPLTRVRITKEKITEDVMNVCFEFYKNLSLRRYLKSNNIKITENPIANTPVKIDTDWYRFDKGIILEDKDHLKIYVINPDIEITNIRLGLDMDLWYKRLFDNLGDKIRNICIGEIL